NEAAWRRPCSRRRRASAPRRRPGLRYPEIDPDGLELRVLVEAATAELAALPALLVAADRHFGEAFAGAVAPTAAGPDRADRLERLRDIARPDHARKAVDRVIGERDCLFRRFKGLYGQHRPENLVAH